MAGSVCGYVVRADNEAPLSGATVIVSGRADAPEIGPMTDSAGWFVLDGLAPGKLLLQARGPNDETGEVTAPIFNNAFTNVTIRVGAHRNTARPEPLFTDRPTPVEQTGGFQGHVVHARTGLPVENATVVVARGPGPAPGIAPLTDSGGWFALDGLAAGDWLLRALGPNEETGEASVSVLSGAYASVTIAVEDPVQDERSSTASPLAAERTVTSRQSGTVEGHVVRAETGLPMENATVTVVKGTGAAPDIAPLTDSAGWFALDGLTPGDWMLRASGPDGEIGEVTFRVRAGETAEVTIAAWRNGRRPASLTLRTKAQAKSSRADKSKKARTRRRGPRSRG